MSLRARHHEPKTEIDLSPLIDMTFILLIFFMVSSSFTRDARLELERPSARSAVASTGKTVRVHVDRHGDIYLEGRPVRPWMVQSHVRDALRATASRDVLIVADRTVSAERLVDVVDQSRLAGAQNVGVATDKEVAP